MSIYNMIKNEEIFPSDATIAIELHVKIGERRRRRCLLPHPCIVYDEGSAALGEHPACWPDRPEASTETRAQPQNGIMPDSSENVPFLLNGMSLVR